MIEGFVNDGLEPVIGDCRFRSMVSNLVKYGWWSRDERSSS